MATGDGTAFGVRHGGLAERPGGTIVGFGSGSLTALHASFELNSYRNKLH